MNVLENASPNAVRAELVQLRDLLGELVPGFASERTEVRSEAGAPSSVALLWSVVGTSPGLRRLVPPPVRDRGRAAVARTLAKWASRADVRDRWGATVPSLLALPARFRLVGGGFTGPLLLTDETEGRADPRVVCLSPSDPTLRTVHTSYVQFVVRTMLWAGFTMKQRWFLELDPEPAGVESLPLIAPGLRSLETGVWEVRPLSYGVRDLMPPKAHLGAGSFDAFVRFLLTRAPSTIRWFEPKYPAATTDVYGLSDETWKSLLPREFQIERCDGPPLTALHAGTFGEVSAIVVRTADPSRRAVLVTEDAARTKTVMKWLREQGLAPSTKHPT